MNRPVPLAFCITELDPGGAERALVRLVTGLDRTEWQPAVYCLAGEAELAAELRRHEVPVACLGARGPGSLWVVPRLASLLRKQRPAILQTFLFHANIAGRLAGRMARVPYVVSSIRVAERRSRIRLGLDRATDRWAARHVCVSQAVAKFSIERGGLPAEKVTVIPNGVDGDLYGNAAPADLAEFGIPSGSPVLLFVGRLDPQKGPLDLLQAVRQLAGRHDDLHCLYVGEGRLRGEIERAVDEAGLRSRVHLAGRRRDVPQLMQAATCLVLPSHWEGMPNVVLEAMAAGLPVVGSRVEGTAELLQPGGESGDFGWLFPAGSPVALAEQIEQLLANPVPSAAAALAAQAYVSQWFTWDCCTAAYVQLYRALLQGE